MFVFSHDMKNSASVVFSYRVQLRVSSIYVLLLTRLGGIKAENRLCSGYQKTWFYESRYLTLLCGNQISHCGNLVQCMWA